MFRLSVLGQIDLRDAAGEEVRTVLAQPKRLALLVYLAAARPQRFHRRDALLPLFWPERPEEGARNALRQALHQLRASLGPDVVVSRGSDSLGVDLTRLTCDAYDFEDALERGQLATALLVYGGDLLPGFSIAGAAAFDEWLDQSRTRHRHRAARAAWAHAEQQERAGSFQVAAASARRASELTLDDEPSIRQLVSLLDRLGDFTGAMRAYEEFTARLRRDLDLEPSPETRQLIDGLRARNRAGSGNAASVGTAPMLGHSVSTTSDAAAPMNRTTATVSTFENLTGDATLAFVGRLVADAVAHGLSETRLVEVIAAGNGASGTPPPRSRSNGDLVIDGSFHLVDDALQLRASMRSADGGRNVGSIATVASRRERPWEGHTSSVVA